MKSLKALKKVKNKVIVNFESNVKYKFDFDNLKLNKLLIKSSLDYLHIHYDISVNISLVKSKSIKKINKERRNIDKVTDVLSFPNIDFRKPVDFKPFIYKGTFDISIVDLSNNTLFLGDIVLNIDRVLEQAKLYGHSVKREYSFLIVHSILHLLGYDHMKKKDEKIMFDLQDKILSKINIKR